MLTPSNLLKTFHKQEIEEISKCPELSDIENGLTGHLKIRSMLASAVMLSQDIIILPIK